MILKIFLTTIFLLILWSSLIEPNILLVNKIEIKDQQLAGTKIVFASDFHIKPYEKYRLKRIIKKINDQKADIILLGGDYVNGHKKGSSMPINEIAKNFSDLKSKYGTYAVIGNHDGWQGKEEIIQELKSNGIHVLLNSNEKAGNIYISGVDDFQTGNPDINKAIEKTKKPLILLTHTPDIFPEIPESVNLTLAGHLHGGQIRIPLKGAVILPSKYGNRYEKGLIIENNRKLFVTKGLGTSILPLRFNCCPEIVVFEFI